MKRWRACAAVLLWLCTFGDARASDATGTAEGIAWQAFDDAAFARARAEGKLVLLNLEAVWCHWCHVMAANTYADPAVAATIEEHFVAIKVDQDARPDLATRYRDYGWPATVLLSPDGVDIAKRAGYIAPAAMRRLLLAAVADPTPERGSRIALVEAPAASPLLADAVRAALLARHASTFDAERGGLRGVQKYLDRDTVEYALLRAADGDADEARMARRTLDAARGLLDPAWGGFYQYSTRGDWAHPHYEKLARLQAGYLRTYALAYGLWRNDADLATLREVVRYVDGFLTSPDGAFYVSQDADLVPGVHAADYFALDDAARRARGLPRVDRNVYARENGALIEALAVAYEFTGDATLLERARRAEHWLRAHRRAPRGGYRHDDRDAGAAFLADNLAVARANLQLYRVTAERAYLEEARVLARNIAARFVAPTAGLLPTPAAGATLPPRPDIDDNIGVARFANLLAHYTADADARALAETAMRYLAVERVALRRATEAGILLAEREFANAPLHLTIRAPKQDTAAQALFSAALVVPGHYKRIEWWDDREGALPNPDVTYPALARPAAFVCTNNLCSVPLFGPAELAAFVARSLPVPAQP